jgi:hypothetical protein
MVNNFMEIQLMFEATKIYHFVNLVVEPDSIETESEKLVKHVVSVLQPKQKKTIKLELCTALTAVTSNAASLPHMICKSQETSSLYTSPHYVNKACHAGLVGCI